MSAALAPGGLALYSKPPALDALYGRGPTSYKIFLRTRPGKMKHGANGAHAHEGHAGGGEN